MLVGFLVHNYSDFGSILFANNCNPVFIIYSSVNTTIKEKNRNHDTYNYLMAWYIGSDLRVPVVLAGLPGHADGGVPAPPRRAGPGPFPRRNMD